jgi:hypothetical protein
MMNSSQFPALGDCTASHMGYPGNRIAAFLVVRIVLLRLSQGRALVDSRDNVASKRSKEV